MAALIFQFRPAAAQVGKLRLFAGELFGQSVEARAFGGDVLNAGAQRFQLAQGRVEGGFASAALEDLLFLAFQQLQRLAGGAQARPEACPVERVTHALGAKAFKIFQFAKAEAEDRPIDVAAHAEQQLPQQVGRKRRAVRPVQGQDAP